MNGPRCVVIGAGFGGLSAAQALRRQGIEDVVLLERAAAVGGVWRDNTYPGAACDVPSPLYSWSWALNPHWSHRYAGQAEILAYLVRSAEQEGLLDLVRTGEDVCSLEYDDAHATWRVSTRSGSTYDADVVVSAVGQLSNPVVPEIVGADSFAGPAFHSARWRHDVSLGGRRVAVVGTGASAVQFVPAIVDQVRQLTVFQRTPPYVVPRPDTEYRPTHDRLLVRRPSLMRGGRRVTFALGELLNRALVGRSWVSRPLLSAVRAVWRGHLRRQVHDPELRRALSPTDPIGCKRVLFSNDWYPALAQDRVDVVLSTVERIEPAGVRTADGVLHEADVLIWGTGFAATDFLASIRVRGRGGCDLHEVWRDGAAAYLGVGIPGFPNLFCVYGPNTNLGGSSIIAMMEAQAAWIAQVTRRLADGPDRTVEVRADAFAAYDAELQARLTATVWSRCSSWYRQGSRITTNWPGLVAEYEDRLAEVDWSALDVSV